MPQGKTSSGFTIQDPPSYSGREPRKCRHHRAGEASGGAGSSVSACARGSRTTSHTRRLAPLTFLDAMFQYDIFLWLRHMASARQTSELETGEEDTLQVAASSIQKASSRQYTVLCLQGEAIITSSSRWCRQESALTSSLGGRV